MLKNQERRPADHGALQGKKDDLLIQENLEGEGPSLEHHYLSSVK
jgi:hypothetical protein